MEGSLCSTDGGCGGAMAGDAARSEAASGSVMMACWSLCVWWDDGRS